MTRKEFDQIREDRITYEIIVDAYDDEEVAMGWYYYLEDHLNFPFLAKWKKTVRKTGKVQEREVKVLGMASEDDCLKQMYVEVVDVDGDEDDVSMANLLDLDAIDPDEETQQALEDWQYWHERM